MVEITKVRKYSSQQWKNLVKGKIAEKNKAEIISEMKSSKNMRNIDFDNAKFETQSYLSTLHLHEAWMRFKIGPSEVCATSGALGRALF